MPGFGLPGFSWPRFMRRALDAAIRAAYGWPANLSDDEILTRLLALNPKREENASEATVDRTAPRT